MEKSAIATGTTYIHCTYAEAEHNVNRRNNSQVTTGELSRFSFPCVPSHGHKCRNLYHREKVIQFKKIV